MKTRQDRTTANSRSIGVLQTLTACVGVAAFVVSANAQSAIEWKAAANGNWNNVANWQPGQVPGLGNVARLSIAGNYWVTLDGNDDVDVGGIEIPNSAASILIPDRSSLRILGTATGSGKIVVNSNFGNYCCEDSRLRLDDGVTLNLPVLLQVGTDAPNNNPEKAWIVRQNLGGTAPIIGQEATIQGSGLMIGAFTVAGTLAPGNPLGRIKTQDGNIVMTPSAKVEIDIQSIQEFDKLVMTGPVQLKGQLSIKFLPSYIPQVTDKFAVIDFASAPLGAFDQIVFTNTPPGFCPRVISTNGKKTMQVSMRNFGDCDEDGQLNINDFICFQTLYSLGDLAADCDGSGTLNIDDFICFQTSFSFGC